MSNNNSPKHPASVLFSLVKHKSDMGEEDSRPIQDVNRHNDGSASKPSSMEGNHDEPKRTCMETVIASFNQEDWRLHVDNKRNVVHTQGTGSNGSFNIAVRVKEKQHLLIINVFCPIRVPEGIQRVKVAEFLTRANFGIMIGNFEMDFADGEIRYKGSLEYADGSITTKMVWQLIQKCAYTMNRYFPGIMRVVYADIEPADAVGEIEPSQANGNALLQAIAEALHVEVVNDDGSDGEVPIVAAESPQT